MQLSQELGNKYFGTVEYLQPKFPEMQVNKKSTVYNLYIYMFLCNLYPVCLKFLVLEHQTFKNNHFQAHSNICGLQTLEMTKWVSENVYLICY
jgi:hypothetical protein